MRVILFLLMLSTLFSCGDKKGTAAKMFCDTACQADTIKFNLNTSNMYAYFNDTSYLWLLFNDCTNGRGYLAKIPFNRSQNIIRKGSALNKFDPKFSVADNLAAYTDRGNIFVEDMTTGKKQ